MALERMFLNHTIEARDGMFDEDRDAQYRTLGRIYNRTLGPITGMRIYRPEGSDPAIYSGVALQPPMGALLRDLTVRSGPAADAALLPGGGKGLSMQRAMLGTLGEASERMFTALYSSSVADTLRLATQEELTAGGRDALGPDRLPLFAGEQYEQPGFEYQPFAPDTRLSWIEGVDLLSGQPILVPAQLVVFGWDHRQTERPVGYATSAGLAFHIDRRRAILRGLCEVIERDAIAIRWYCGLPPAILDLDIEDFLGQGTGRRRVRLATTMVGPARAYLNTLDVPLPVFTAFSDHGSLFLSGGGGGVSRDEALMQAVLEVGQTRGAFRLLDKNNWLGPDTPVSQMNDFHHAVIFYGYQKNRWRTSWYTAGEDVVGWNSVPTLAPDEEEAYPLLLDILRAAGIRPIVVDLASRAWPGLSVVKVLVPELVQAGIPSHPWLGHPRFYELPLRLGLRDRRLSYDDLSCYPPPLP